MTLKAVIEKEDDIPENFRGEYIEKDGKWHLDVDDTFRSHPSVTALSGALEAHKRQKTELQTKLNELKAKADRADSLPDDFDLDEYKRLHEEEERRKKDPNYKPDSQEALSRMKDQYESRIRALETKYTTDISAKDQVIAANDAALRRRVGGEELGRSLVAAGVSKEYLEATQALLGRMVKVIDSDDGGEELQAIVTTDLGDIPVAQFVENWAKSDAGKPFVKAPVGGGASGSTSRSTDPNPFSDAHWNVTEQGRVIKEKGQDVANRMAKAAGTTVGGPRPVKARSAA